MHAVIASVEIQDEEEGRRMLQDVVVPTASQAPGFVAGYWVRVGEANGRSMMVMESEEEANALAEVVRSRAGGPVRLVDVQVGEVVANA
jgi:hypothetical protein